jgi:hypothetical protein
MTLGKNLRVLATHGGKFHCDEVFAYAVLRLALGLQAAGEDHVLHRTRKPELIEGADIVWDVGSLFDAAANRFDHHQRGAPLRADGTPFSSAGLVWQVYGERAVAALLRARESETFAGRISAELEGSIVKRIDEIDNGMSATGPVTDDALGLAALRPPAPPPGTKPFWTPRILRWACCAGGLMGCARACRRKAWCLPRTPPARTPASSCSIAACRGKMWSFRMTCRCFLLSRRRLTETG